MTPMTRAGGYGLARMLRQQVDRRNGERVRERVTLLEAKPEGRRLLPHTNHGPGGGIVRWVRWLADRDLKDLSAYLLSERRDVAWQPSRCRWSKPRSERIMSGAAHLYPARRV